MKILVTGGNGFTGRHFINSASLAGHEVLSLRSNLLDIEALACEIKEMDFDYVVHLGAISFVGQENVNAFYEVNVIGSLNLLNVLASRSVRPKKILLASSANIYGNTEASPITELQVMAPLNHYAASKCAMEAVGSVFSRELPLFFVRPFNYTGVGQSEKFVIPKIVSHFLSKAESIELGNLDVEREFNDVRFVCESYLKLLPAAEIGQAYNICTGQPISLRAVLDELVQLTSHQIEVRVNPSFVRLNEIARLHGDPSKLKECIGVSSSYKFRETLNWMLGR